MKLARLGLLLAALAPPLAAQTPRADGTSPGPESSPIEVRLEDPWRWRQIHPPPGEETRYLLVRPWRDGDLIALDAGGLRAFDGWSWYREPGWAEFDGKGVDEILPLQDGVLVIQGKGIATIDRTGVVARRKLLERVQQITDTVRMPDGSLVFAAGSQLWRLTSTDLDAMEALWEPPDGATEYTALTLDGQGRLWCATDIGIFWRGADRWHDVSPRGAPPTRVAHAFLVGRQLHFLPSSIDNITPGLVWDGDELLPFQDKGRPVVVGDAALSPDNALVFTVNTPSLRVYRDGTWADATPPLATVERIRSICITSERRLGLVTSSGRLWVCDLASRRWEAHDPSGSGLSPSIAAVTPSPSRGGLWVGTHAGLGRWDGHQFTDVHSQAGDTDVPLRQVTGLMEDARGRLWVGSGSGFRGALCLDGETWTHYAGEHEVGARFVHVIRRIGDDLWFPLIGDDIPGQWERGGIVRLRGDTFETFPTADGSPLLRSYDVVSTDDGRILAGTRHRVYELVDDVWQPWDIPQLSKWTAWALHPDVDGSLWIGLGLHEEGLILVQPDRSAHMLNEGSWLYTAAASFCRANGRLWFASVSGLFLVDGRDCHEISGKLPARNFWPVVSDGATGLWLGTLGSGLVHYVPDDNEAPRAREPHVFFASQNRHALVRLDATDRWNVTLPEQLRFRVHLDGRPVPLTGEWSGELRSHMVDLGRLPWGRHEVSVEAVDGLGNASERRSHAFDVDPPIWLRPPLLASMAAVAVALGWIVVVGRSRRRERRQAQRAQAELAERLSILARKLLSSQEDERKNISRELHDDLGQLLTAVTLDLQHADRGDGIERRAAMQRALATTRTALGRVRELSSLLRPPVLDDLGLEQAVHSLIEEFTTRSGVDVQIDLELGPGPLPDSVAGQAYRIIQEALTNVARHASAETAFVTLRVRDGRLDLNVSDDGRGFDQEAVTVNDRFGLLGMRERAELLGGSFRLESRVGSGTSIRVSMPLPAAGSPPPGTPDPPEPG
jgi:signal transduction histidine kinase